MSLRNKLFVTSVMLTAFAAASPASAVTTFFSDFDDIDVPDGSFILVAAADGWTRYSGPWIEVQDNPGFGAPFSEPNHVELDSTGNSGMERTIDPGKYTLTFYYSPRVNVPASSNGINVLLGDTSIFSVTGDGGSQSDWSLQTVNFTVHQQTQLRFHATGTSNSLGGYLDDIGLAGTAVPEPTTWAMMIGGFGLIGAAMRRRGRLATRLA